MSLQKLTSELYQAYDQKNFEQCHKILPAIKVELIKHNLLVPLPSNSGTEDQLNDLDIAQKILEIGALSALQSDLYEGFENCFAHLKPFYNNKKLHSGKEVNTNTTKIESLYLLYLLSQGSISKFHVELEVIYNSDKYDVENDKYLQFPISLEKHLMEGNYIKIWKLLKDKDLPCEEYTHFIETLNNALRYEIAKSLVKTYDSIPISNCKNLLYFPQEDSDAVFESTLKEELGIEDFTIENGVIYFRKSEDVTEDSMNVVSNVLSYAEQIESIV